MARPQKAGIDYFSLDVDMDQDDKVLLIEAKHKITGFAVLLKLLMKIYKEGYFYKWTEREQLLFSSRINIDTGLVNEIVNDCIKWELFNPERYEKYNIITSSGIQKRYLEAIVRRKEVTLIAEYLVIETPISTDKFTVNIVNVDINQVNVDINTTQEELIPSLIPKVKESKEKQTKVYTTDESEVLSTWNSKGIINHNESEPLKKEIAKALKKLGKEKVIHAITQYSILLHDADFYYSNKFTLANFLKQGNGLPNFLDDGQMWANYLSREKKGINKPNRPKSFDAIDQWYDMTKEMNDNDTGRI